MTVSGSGKKGAGHERKARYYSSNVNVATVNRDGKVRPSAKAVVEY